VRPRRAGEEEHQVDLFPAIAIPLLVGNVLDPVEVRHRRVVEQYVDPAECAHGEIDQRLAVAWLGELARLQGDHRASRGPNHCDRGFSRVDVETAPDDGCTFPSECHCRRSAHAPASPRDDTHFS
jgi:hypothetical protein